MLDIGDFLMIFSHNLLLWSSVDMGMGGKGAGVVVKATTKKQGYKWQV